MDIRFTISAMGEASLSVTGIKEITHLEVPATVEGLQTALGRSVNSDNATATSVVPAKKRRYNRKKKNSRRNRRR